MPVLLHGVPQRLLTRGRAGKNLDLATAVIVKPLDPPLTGCITILEHYCGLCHAAILLRC
jgi:hypothetical protein